MKTIGFLLKVYEISRSEMALGLIKTKVCLKLDVVKDLRKRIITQARHLNRCYSQEFRVISNLRQIMIPIKSGSYLLLQIRPQNIDENTSIFKNRKF